MLLHNHVLLVWDPQTCSPHGYHLQHACWHSHACNAVLVPSVTGVADHERFRIWSSKLSDCVQLRLCIETRGGCVCRLKGYAGQALAFSLMKHETYWANTDRALVDQWQSGRAGRLSLIAAIQGTLRGPDLQDFLECMDAVCEEPEPFKSKSLWVTLSRLFLFTVPRYRIK